jgi:hypothetical protein
MRGLVLAADCYVLGDDPKQPRRLRRLDRAPRAVLRSSGSAG